MVMGEIVRGIVIVLFLSVAGGAIAAPLTFGDMHQPAGDAPGRLLVSPVNRDAVGSVKLRVSPLLAGTDTEPFTGFQTTTGKSALGMIRKPAGILAEFGAGFPGVTGSRLPD